MNFICPWLPIDGFESLVEFRSFERWMTGQVSGGLAKQVPVVTPYRHGDQTQVLIEIWYMHLMSRETWRLVVPEPPFNGIFRKIS
jgi:hypothetical protein